MQHHHLLIVAMSVVLMAGHTAAFQHPPFGAFSRANPALRPVASHDGGGVVRKSGIGIGRCSNLGSPKVMFRHVGHARCSGRITALALPAPPFSHTLTIDIGADQQHRWRAGPANACVRRKIRMCQTKEMADVYGSVRHCVFMVPSYTVFQTLNIPNPDPRP